MKKGLALVMALSLLLALTACGGNDTPAAPSEPASSVRGEKTTCLIQTPSQEMTSSRWSRSLEGRWAARAGRLTSI